ncbi:MAG: hypothetical protein JXA89_22975, partial [Anaerolineae bacterium]|nr:hypothetical protein [Anaerolineae bacterium]
ILEIPKYLMPIFNRVDGVQGRVKKRLQRIFLLGNRDGVDNLIEIQINEKGGCGRGFRRRIVFGGLILLASRDGVHELLHVDSAGNCRYFRRYAVLGSLK